MIISKNKLKNVYIISSIIIVSISVYWSFSNLIFISNHPFEHKLFQNIFVNSTRIFAAISILYLAYLYKPVTKVGKFWLMLGLGSFLKTIGELIFSFFHMSNIPPFPSIADIFFLSAYPFWYIAFYIQIKLIPVKLSSVDKLLVFGVFISICIFTLISVIILPIIELYPYIDVFLLALGAFYPLGDLILLISILIQIAKLRKGKVEYVWILILVGFLIYLIANIIFSWSWVVIQKVTGYTITSVLQAIAHIFILNGALTEISLMKNVFNLHKNES